MNRLAFRLLTVATLFTLMTPVSAQPREIAPTTRVEGFGRAVVTEEQTPDAAASTAPPSNAGPLETARHYYGEKSYKLAVNTVDEANTSTLNEDARRELQYIKGQAHDGLNQQHLANQVYSALIEENDSDAWAGRSHWRLQPGLNERTWLDVNTSDPLKHLRRADRILADLKTDDLDDLYMAVVNSQLVNQYYPQEGDRDYIMSIFDKLIPMIAGQDEMIAGVQMRRIEAAGAQNPERTPEERLDQLRGIVSEFPRTRAAARAQWEVAQYYIGRREYGPALYELSLLTNQFPGTDEARRAAAEIDKIKRPEAMFSLPGQFRTDEKVTFQLLARNTQQVRFTATPFEPMEEIRRQKVTRLDLEAVQGKATFTDTVSVDMAPDHMPTSRSVTLDIKKPGTYVVRAEAGGKVTAHAMLLISDLVIVGNNGPQGYEFWTVEAETGKPRPNTQVNVAHTPTETNHWLTGQRSHFFKEFTNLETNSDGFADFKPGQNNGQIFAVARNGEHTALLDNINWYPHYFDRTDQPMIYVYTDRPVYRPEQKVYWRAIVRERADGDYRMPDSSKRYGVRVRDPQGQEVYYKQDLALTEFGSISGELDLVTDAPLGAYHFEIMEPGDRNIGNGQFRVEEYKKPEFEVSVESASDFAKVGDEIKAKVEAQYLFGSPVTDATVQYTVRRRPRYRILWDNISWHLDDRDLGWFEDAPERPQTLHGSGGTIVAQGEGKVDANGEFTLTFDSAVPDEELKQMQHRYPRGGYGHRGFSTIIWPPAPQTWEFQVEVTVTDASRRNIDASQVIPVGLKALQLAAKTDRNIVTPGDNARVELKSMNLAEKPIATSGTLYVEKLTWNESEQEDDVTTISTQQVSVEASGSLILNWRVPDDVSGRLRFAYIVEDPFGGPSVAYANFYAASADDTDISTRYQGVEIVTDRTRYTVGETARVMILNEYKDAAAWYWIDTGSGNLHKQVLPLPHRTNFVTIPITDAFVPNSMIHIVAVRDKQIIMDQVELIVPPTKKVINVKVTPAESTVEPGQSGQVTLQATDHNGEPVSAELSLSVFDQAITYIAPDMRPDIRKTFYGTKRNLRSDIRASLDVAQGYGGVLIEDIHQYMWFARDGQITALYGGAQPLRREMASRSMSVDMPPPMMAPASAMGLAESSSNRFAFDDAAVAQEGIPGLAKVELDSAGADAAEQPAIRADFRDSMFWSPTVRTDADGSATVKIKYPDSLTTWRMVTVGLTPDTQVGNETTETVARKKVLVRLQTPRFFRERDEVTISANLHNYTNSELPMDATLRAKGVALDGATTMPLQHDEAWQGQSQQVTVPAGGEVRVDWNVNVESAAAGDAVLNLMALSSGGSDAMQTTVPLLPHGIDKFVAWNGTSRDESSTGVTVETSGSARIITQTVSLPAERIKETSRLEILVNPSLASSIREAIPYMIEYPYGCVEQTMSRFMPATVAARAFEVLGYPLDESMQERLPQVTEQGLKRLRDMQLPSGSWGWWANDNENLTMTSYVMYGLTLARDAEVTVEPAMFDRGLHRLAQLRDDATSKVAERNNPQRTSYWWPGNLHDLMFAEYVLTLNNQSSPRTIQILWDRRDDLTAHGLAMLARTMGKLGRTADAEVALRNMYNVAAISPENNTLRWGRIDAGYRWYDDAVEATAVGLMAYLEIRPDDPAVDQAMKWLVLNRQGGRWKSTKDTAQSVLALTQYMLQRNEAARPVNVQVHVGDRLVRTLNVTPQNFWDFDGRIVLRGNEIPDGEFPLRFTVEGEGNIYYSVFAEYFTLEEGIEDAGNEIYVTRTYEILKREQTTETVSGKPSTIYKDTWLPLKDGDPVNSGDELRVTLKIKSLNDYEYLVFEDPKPAGMEPVDLQSGTKYGNGLCSNMELRDKWVAFFMTTLRQGEHTLTYNVRAEIPGTFHTMPTTGYAMYFPPLRTNSDEVVIEVRDKQ